MYLVRRVINILAQIFGCKISDFPIKYLGVPLHYGSLEKKIFNQLLMSSLSVLQGGDGDCCLMPVGWFLLDHVLQVLLFTCCQYSYSISGLLEQLTRK
jgi:hypothetical protein